MPENESRVPSVGVVGLGEHRRRRHRRQPPEGRRARRRSATSARRPPPPTVKGPAWRRSPRDLAGTAGRSSSSRSSTTPRSAPCSKATDGVFAGAADGTTVVIVSTITDRHGARHARRRLGARGVTVVDCGVSGGPYGAAAGELVCMVGGTEEEVDRIRPVLDVFSRLVLHMGPAGRRPLGQAGAQPDHRTARGCAAHEGTGARRGRRHRPAQAGRGDPRERPASSAARPA